MPTISLLSTSPTFVMPAGHEARLGPGRLVPRLAVVQGHGSVGVDVLTPDLPLSLALAATPLYVAGPPHI